MEAQVPLVVGRKRKREIAVRARLHFTAIKERWGYWSDGCGGLVPFCPECARREFVPMLVLLA
jgi:hypothetical protein